MNRRTRELGVVIGGLAPLGLAFALVPLRDHLQASTVALFLVVVVVAAAAVGGWRGGAVAAVVSTLAFDFLYTKPYQSLHMQSAQDVETALVLLFVGVLVGNLAASGSRARSLLRRSRGELRSVQRVAAQTARGAASSKVLLVAEDELTEMLRLQECRFEAAPFAPPLPRFDAEGRIDGVHFYDHITGGTPIPLTGVEVPVVARGHEIGRFVLVPHAHTTVSVEQRLAAMTIADHVGAVISGGNR